MSRIPRRAEIGLPHFLVLLDLSDAAFRQHLAEMHDGDALGDLPHERHVVLDHKDGVTALQLVDQAGGLLRFRLRHPGSRFVEQEHLRILHDEHRQFQPLGLSVAQVCGKGFGLVLEPDHAKHVVNPFPRSAGKPEPQIGEDTGIAAARHLQIAPDRQFLEDAGDLKLASELPAWRSRALPNW